MVLVLREMVDEGLVFDCGISGQLLMHDSDEFTTHLRLLGIGNRDIRPECRRLDDPAQFLNISVNNILRPDTGLDRILLDEILPENFTVLRGYREREETGTKIADIILVLQNIVIQLNFLFL